MATLNTSTSIVDAVKATGGDSSFAGRTALASSAGISNYTGTASQNAQLIAYVNSGAGKSTSSTPASTGGGVVVNSGGATATTANNVTNLNNINASYNQNTSGTQQGNTTANTATNIANQGVSDLNALSSSINAYTQQLQSQYASLKANNDAIYQKTLTTLGEKFDLLRTQLSDANTRFQGKTTQNQYSVNGFRYAPQQAEGLVYQAELKGINELKSLEIEREGLIQEANQAKLKNDAEFLNTNMKLIDDNTTKRLNVIKEMNNYAKNIAEQVASNQKQSATNFANMSKNIENDTVFYNSLATPELKKAWIADYAKNTGQNPEMVKSALENYASSAKQFKTDTSIAKKAGASGVESTSGKTNAGGSIGGTAEINKAPDSKQQRQKEIEKDIKEIKASSPNFFDKNGYLKPEMVNAVVAQYVKQGYPETEVRKTLDGYIYDENDDGAIERLSTSWFGYKR